MLPIPKNQKYLKARKGRLKSQAKRGGQIVFGDYAFKALTPARVSSAQINSARLVIAKKVKKNGKMWIRVFPDIPVTKKPNEVRMGKGKGAVDRYVVRIAPGHILFEVAGVSLDVLEEMFPAISAKFPVKIKLIKRYV